MAETSRSKTLDSPAKRLALHEGVEHSQHLMPGVYLLYRRAPGLGVGKWSARYYDPETRKKTRTPLGMADDVLPPDGRITLDWVQAKRAAERWAEGEAHLAHERATGEVIKAGVLTAGDCLDAYLRSLEREGKSLVAPAPYIKTRIKPALGTTPVNKLTKKKIEDWLDELAKSPCRVRGQKYSAEGEWGAGGPTEDQLKSRRNTANRILAILKRALTLAVESGRYSGPQGWRDVKPLRNAGAPRVRFLSTEEQVRLVNACPPDLRDLVIAALYTGSRFGPLSRLRVRDVDASAKAIWVERDKGGKSRWIHLTPEGAEWFAGQVAGRAGDELMLTRATAPGRQAAAEKAVSGGGKRPSIDPLQWRSHDYDEEFAAACKAAKLEAITFHELRHTYASHLVNEGVPLAYVAEQLGHVNTRMVEQHYGHLCPSAMRDAISRLPERHLTDAPKVTALAPARRA